MFYIVKVVIVHNNGKQYEDAHYYSQYEVAKHNLNKLADRLRVKMERKEIKMYHVELNTYTG